MQRSLRAVTRFIFFASYTSLLIVRYFGWRAGGCTATEAGRRVRRTWLRVVPPRMGLSLHQEGEPFLGTCLYVGNHISYIDPILILMFVDAHVVAKAEVAKWPLVGFGARLGGTLFVNREERQSRMKTASSIREALAGGMSILVFPEGTTSAGPQTLPFRPRSFEAAREAGVGVQPVAIYYDLPQAAYIGEDSFLPHFFRLFRERRITARITFGPLLQGADTCPAAKTWIDETQMTYHQQTLEHASA